MIFRHSWKKSRTFGEELLAFYQVFRIFDKNVFCVSRKNIWVNFSGKKMFFTFWKTAKKSFRSLVEVFGTSVKTAVSVPKKNNLIFFEKFVLNIFFFFIWAIEVEFLWFFSGDSSRVFLCVKSFLLRRNIFFSKILGTFSGKRAKMFSDFSQIFSLGMSRVFSIYPEEFWGLFLGKRVLLQHLCTLSKKVEAVWQKCYRQGCKVEFHVSKATVHSNLSLKEKQIFPRFQTRSNKSFGRFNRNFQQDCQTCSLSDRWNNLWEKVEIFICHAFEILGR